MGQKNSKQRQQTIEAIQGNGHKIDPDQTIRAWKVPATSEFPMPSGRPQHMWLETGNQRAGFAHMQTEKKIKSFERVGIQPSDQPQHLPILLEAHTTVGRHISYQGKDTTRPIMATYVGGKVQKGAVTVASNGYAVGMNPVTNVKPKPDDPHQVSDRTMRNLYYYPPHLPDRRTTESPRLDEQVRAAGRTVVRRGVTR